MQSTIAKITIEMNEDVEAKKLMIENLVEEGWVMEENQVGITLTRTWTKVILCQYCAKSCQVTYKDEFKRSIMSITCPDCGGDHDSGDYSYICGSNYCRCCN